MVISVMFPFNWGWYSKVDCNYNNISNFKYSTKLLLFLRGYVLGPQNATQYTVWVMFYFSVKFNTNWSTKLNQSSVRKY